MSATEKTATGSSSESKGDTSGMGCFSSGTIMWHELPVLSQARAQAFYSTLFGWTFTPSPMPTPEGEEAIYVLFSNSTKSTNGGFFKVAPENHVAPTHAAAFGVRVTIGVEDVDDTLKAVEKAGGSMWTKKDEIPGGMGFTAAFKDTEGNIMGLWAKHDKAAGK